VRWNELRALAGSLDLGEPGSARRPPRDNVVALEEALGAGLRAEEFVLDLLERQLDVALGGWETAGGRAVVPPVDEIRERGIVFRFSYWTPGSTALPHEHTSWTVNAVIQNTLLVTNYDWETAERERRLKERGVLLCTRGRTEHLYADAIHRVTNPTNRLAASIHVFNSDDAPVLAKRVGPIEGLVSAGPVPHWPVEKAAFEHEVKQWRQKLLLMHADVVGGFRSRRSLSLLERISALGDPLVKFVVAMTVKQIDAERSTTLLQELAEIAPEYEDREELVTVRS
jgi:hypothetical protein